MMITTALVFLSCAAGMIEPGRGVTSKFFNEVDGRIVNLATYDFSRLQKGCGLCVFSYDYSGSKGNRIIGFRDQHTRGLRVWESRFESTGWEMKWMDKKVLVWGYRSLLWLFLTKEGYGVTLRVPFHRNRIVYAGRLVVDLKEFFTEGPSTEFHFEEDMRPWLDQFGERVTGIKIDTAMLLAHPLRGLTR